jgi:hypothetical protein
MKYEVTKDPSIFVGEYLKLQDSDNLPIYFFVKEVDASYQHSDGQYIMLEGIGYQYVICGPNMKGINHREAHIYTYFQIFEGKDGRTNRYSTKVEFISQEEFDKVKQLVTDLLS